MPHAAMRSPSPPTPSPSPPPTFRSTPVLAALAHRAEHALQEVTAAHHAFVSNRTTRQHGALSLAVAHAQHVLKALETMREQRERQRQQQQQQQNRSTLQPRPVHPSRTAPSTTPPPPSTVPAPSKEELMLYVRIDKVRIDLRRVLPRAVAAMEESGNLDGGEGSSRSAASTAAALRSLLHTRSMLSVELKKMDTAVHGLASSGESLAALHQSLQDVHSSMATAQRMVRRLLTVQSRDDLLLRLSAVLFVVVVLYVVAQRVFRFFPVTVYVTVGDD
ncbi:hypothetical protein ABB37_07311 [Leptomonas pyrrhocoris]|uniref:Sec20 C-terminal domain-containing protein n=1 Tax=Leptomonas pyrrhocoris TaxID=157538 RepID=A0A0N0VDZ1_LEPPY|nr:hypothetical protein ABB37_07311 [Leptomonas pyrrhocoris]KPA76932.1 hypothetical protein ABB37_07311 [Leptomonas pyrrhocoris]|eukprot:XP_015655371.1 hypothetical protein ABB37_07311 [Leptomonas pyrrhocoris]